MLKPIKVNPRNFFSCVFVALLIWSKSNLQRFGFRRTANLERHSTKFLPSNSQLCTDLELIPNCPSMNPFHTEVILERRPLQNCSATMCHPSVMLIDVNFESTNPHKSCQRSPSKNIFPVRAGIGRRWVTSSHQRLRHFSIPGNLFLVLRSSIWD